MSTNPTDPDFSPDSPEFEDRELESLLKKLEPSALDVRLLNEFQGDYERIAETEIAEATALRWHRLIPLSIAACVVFASYLAFQYAPLFRGATTPEVAESRPIAVPGGAPASTSASVEGFVPVSAQGYLIDSSSGGVVDTAEGPREKLNLEYRDAYHWHDPATETNIRYFKPRSEEVIVPLPTR
ncbi:MAG: hypothetical protein P1U85_02630 [Verrucomicrobiales bacterium]|nr:hypothetical protein [Verrucomicrobiales bacterium]